MKKHYLYILALAALLFTSCKDEETPTPDDGKSSGNVPSTYSFDDVSFSGQITRQDMLSAIKVSMSTAHDGSSMLDATILDNMYNGTGFTGEGSEALNTSGKNLADKMLATGSEKFFDPTLYINGSAETSNTLNGVTATDSTAGLVVRGSGFILVDSKGFEYVQVIEKGLMSTVFMDQALNNYLNEIELDDNTSTSFKEGEGTTMAHHWDEAYGYFTDSKEFPTSGTDRFWGDYSNDRDAFTNTNKTIGNAFRTGRQAIIDNDIPTATAQAAIIKSEWTKLAAANVIHYFNDVKEYITENETGNQLHALSEAYGFLLGVKVGGGDVNEMISYLETTGLYNVSETKLTEYINTLATTYELETVKNDL